MRKQRCDGQETRHNLLAAASEIFAAKGFKATTIAEVCRLSGANAAAVSYHFGGKEALYVESWRHAFDESLRRYPPDGAIPAEAPAEERLRGRILAIMRRIVDPQSYDFDIFHKEMANPTGLLAEAMQESMERILGGLTLLVGELLDRQSNDDEVQLCAMSIRAQCFGPLLHARRRKTDQGVPICDLEPLLSDVAQLAEHVTIFSLAGIRALREQRA